MAERIKVTVWDEGIHEKTDQEMRRVYPEGISAVIAGFLNEQEDIQVRIATLDMPEHGLTEDMLSETDVLTWWAHAAHDKVDEVIVDRVQQSVLNGMGLIVLHSGHFSKIFRHLMGTDCSLKWRETGEKERLWLVNPGHPIARGLGEYFELPHTEMYGEFFDVPPPDEVVFISWFAGGDVFRSGCCWQRGLGRVFYFRPGHETFSVYHDANVQKVITNAVRWARKAQQKYDRSCQVRQPLEQLGS